MAMVSSRHTAAMSWKSATLHRLIRKSSSHHIRKRTWGWLGNDGGEARRGGDEGVREVASGAGRVTLAQPPGPCICQQGCCIQQGEASAAVHSPRG